MNATDIFNTLYVQTPGSHVSLDGDAVRCHIAGSDAWRRLPLARVESIVLIGAVSATSDLLLRCADEGRAVFWLSEFGRPRASVLGPFGGRGAIRSAQHVAHSDPAHRVRLAHAFVLGKIVNMRAFLRLAAHDATGHDGQALREAINRTTVLIDRERESSASATRERTLGIEGAASRFYFTGLRHALHPEAAVPIPATRARHPSPDPINATMSFAYGLTRSAVMGAIHAASLDPAIGYLHGDRDGQPSLALDLMEELRPRADHVVVTLFNRKQLRAEHFEQAVSGAVQMTEEGRKILFSAWHEHRQSTTSHVLLRRDVPQALVPQIQARILVRHLTGDIPSYLPHREH